MFRFSGVVPRFSATGIVSLIKNLFSPTKARAMSPPPLNCDEVRSEDEVMHVDGIDEYNEYIESNAATTIQRRYRGNR